MVLQLTDFTSEITDEELVSSHSEYNIHSHCTRIRAACWSASYSGFPVGMVGDGIVFHSVAGRLQCYTEKLDALRRWREMFFWVDDALVPWDFAFYTQGSLPRDERPPPGSYSMEDAELINENQMDLFSVWAPIGIELEQPEVESTDVLAPTPLRSVPGATAEPPRLDATSVVCRGLQMCRGSGNVRLEKLTLV
ncbi:hypothetical protein Tco_0955825 [Tanacetum coccineum]|uniref:Uncharacterized protein n=1 Tax=Tanacetum coccineum TaxID=301880 RepID=A0ABQ5E8B0_9ASTR